MDPLIDAVLQQQNFREKLIFFHGWGKTNSIHGARKTYCHASYDVGGQLDTWERYTS